MDIREKNIAKILAGSRHAFFYVIFFSCLINILMLTVPLYMLQLFDRVLPSQSHDTLINLTLISVLAVCLMGVLEFLRGQVLTRVSHWIDGTLSPLALAHSIDHTLLGGRYGAQSLADITNLRQFLSSTGVYAFFDAPWVFIYLLIIFLLDSTLGLVSTIGAVCLFSLAILNELVSRKPLIEANNLYLKNQEAIASSLKNAESIQAMGMLPSMMQRWLGLNEQVLHQQCLASDRSGIVLALSKVIRMMLQVLILGLGAYYVLEGELTGGAMIAASIIMGRALAPVEQAIGAWKQALGAWQAFKRLQQYLNTTEARPNTIALPTPSGRMDIGQLVYVPQGTQKPILQGISFTLMPGQSLGIIGPSAAGKSTLARLLVGIWPPSFGFIRLDGANIYEWDRDSIGEFVGYLPQGVMLFRGSIKDNIARMGEVQDEKVIAAAQFVNAHEMILRLTQGYETDTGSYHLSGGQAQRIALARAFYGFPKVVVLDEPESNLDQEGMSALELVLRRSKEVGITLIVVSQRHALMKYLDQTLLLNEGRMVKYGKYEDNNPS